MKLVALTLFSACLAVAFSKKQKVYISQEFQCKPFPKSHICNIEHEVDSSILANMESISKGINDTLNRVKSLEGNENCSKVFKEFLCQAMFTKCEKGVALPVSKKMQNDTCHNMIPDGEQCKEQTLKAILPKLCTSFKEMENASKVNMIRCAKKDKKVDETCPSVSNIKKVLKMSDEVSLTSMKNNLEQLKLNESCNNNFQEVICAFTNPVCLEKDSLIVGYIMDRETCEEKVKCFNMTNSVGGTNRQILPTSGNTNGSLEISHNDSNPLWKIPDMNITIPSINVNMTVHFSQTGLINFAGFCQGLPFRNASTVALSEENGSGNTNGHQTVIAIPSIILGLGLLVVLIG